VRRTPRRQTGKYKTNRESRWKLNPKHPDYTAADQIPLIEAKLLATTLEFDDAPDVPAEIVDAAGRVIGHVVARGTYRCPVSGRPMSFRELSYEAEHPTHGKSCFQVGHVKPKAKGGSNVPDNAYWNSDLGNRIQGDKSWQETVRTVIEMGEYHRTRENIEWGELVNRYLG
jgi:hypothetical protein